jgi:DNA modification methylase
VAGQEGWQAFQPPDVVQDEVPIDRAAELQANPFCGSGTTLVAAHQLGRVGYGVEIDLGYVTVTLERLSALGASSRADRRIK